MIIDCRYGERGWRIYDGAIRPDRKMYGMIYIDDVKREYCQAVFPYRYVGNIPISKTQRADRIIIDRDQRVVIINPTKVS